MTAGAALEEGTDSLGQGHSASPFLDASILLAASLGIERDKLLCDRSLDLQDPVLCSFRGLLVRRKSGESVARILGHREFYGRDFIVSEAVLEPRPETELLVDLALRELDLISRIGQNAPIALHDACTGSGCVGISISGHRPGAVVVSLSDISLQALAVARNNSVGILGFELVVFESNFLESVPGRFSIVTANPPYVRSSEAVRLLREKVLCDPIMALDGGEDGLVPLRTLAYQVINVLECPGVFISEIGDDQGSDARRIFADAGFQGVELKKDLAGHDRVIVGRKP